MDRNTQRQETKMVTVSQLLVRLPSIKVIYEKYYNARYAYKTKECLEPHDKLHHSQQGREQVEELKGRNCRAIFKERVHKSWNRLEEIK